MVKSPEERLKKLEERVTALEAESVKRRDFMAANQLIRDHIRGVLEGLGKLEQPVGDPKA